MNKIKILGLIALTSMTLFLISVFALFYVQSSINDYVELDTTLIIGQEVGFNLDNDALHFGTIRYKGTSKRTINIPQNNGELLIKIEGNISQFIYLENIHESSNQLNFLAIAKYQELGYYEGKIRIYNLKRNNFFITKLLGGQDIPFQEPQKQQQNVQLNISR
ncbi:MAG: hypothetical protein ACMXX9_01400 [Candidatus Woesearchaeota archaeon]